MAARDASLDDLARRVGRSGPTLRGMSAALSALSPDEGNLDHEKTAALVYFLQDSLDAEAERLDALEDDLTSWARRDARLAGLGEKGGA